ncbi:MAG: hypothetical protein ACD_76C00029G0003 [uncultured bacterium]|nr:MAG: hypothetical protein ACD_76C00029G0003 [uncultured bacterium]HBD05238.1 hypothetical protein [Candidatus Uhrbacteria bacterium]
MPKHAVMAVKVLAIDTIADIFAFPFWWYSQGLEDASKACVGSVSNMVQILAVKIWIKNLLVPMYGATDIGGRIISFAVRLVQIIGRSIVLAVWSAVFFVVFLLYVFVPALAVIGILFHLEFLNI